MSHTLEREWTTGAGLRAACHMVHGTHRCGYVEVPLGHPLHGVSYNQTTTIIPAIPEDTPIGKRSPFQLLTAGLDTEPGETLRRSPEVAFDVHGGLTYSGGKDGYPGDGDGWWFGFDCAHAGDGQLGRAAEWSDGPVRTTAYVVEECEALARQIVQMFPPVGAS